MMPPFRVASAEEQPVAAYIERTAPKLVMAEESETERAILVGPDRITNRPAGL